MAISIAAGIVVDIQDVTRFCFSPNDSSQSRDLDSYIVVRPCIVARMTDFVVLPKQCLFVLPVLAIVATVFRTHDLFEVSQTLTTSNWKSTSMSVKHFDRHLPGAHSLYCNNSALGCYSRVNRRGKSQL
jgi:hypothetical protein